MRVASLLIVSSVLGCHHGGDPLVPASEEHYGVTIEDDEAWNLAHPERCREATRASDCTGVREYMADFPTGKHATEAKQLIDTLAARLAAVPEDTGWDAADAAACKRADDLEACDDLASYLARYPLGKHAAEARATLDAAKPKLEERRRVLDDAGIEVEILGTDHTGKDCPPLLGDKEHHALCIVLDVRVRREIKLQALGVMTDCGVEKGQPKKLHWATGKDLSKLAIGVSTDLHVAVPRSKRCTIEVGIGNVPKLEREGLRRICLIGADDPKNDRAEAGSCGDAT